MISFKEYVKRVDEGQKGNTYSYEKDSGAKGLAHKVGDSVWAKHPTEKYKTLAGKVTKIGRTFTTLQHKDGTEATYPHADVSADFSKLNPNPYRKNESVELDESGWIGGIAKWKEAVHAKHGYSLPTFKKVAHPGSPGKSTTYARSSQTGNIIGVYQHHNKSGTVHESVELDESASRFIQKVNQAANAAASGKHTNAKMHLDNARTFMLGVKSTDMSKIHDAHETYKNLRKKYSGSGGNFTPSHNQVGNAKVTSESEELDEGSIANIEQKLKDHAKRKIDHEAKFGQMNGADLHSHEVTRTRLLQQKKKLQSAKMRAESVELDEAKLQRLPGEQDDDFLTRRDKIRAKAGTLGGIPNQKPVNRGARNSTEVRSEYSDMIYRSKKNESVELDEADGLTTKKNKNGGHDVYHNGTHIGHVEQKSMPWLRGKTIKKVFAKKPNGDSVVVDSDDMGKNTIESAKKTLLKHHLAESEEISEDNPYMWKIEGGKGKGKEFAHKSTTVDDHLSAMSYHSTEYQKAMKEKRDSDARHHGMKYHKHKDQIERLGNSGSYLKDSVELDEAMSPEQRTKLDDLIQDYQFASDPEADPYDNETADPDDILDQIKKEFGAKVAKQVEDGTMKMHYPRKNHTAGYDYLAAKNKVDRTTKAGKMFKQDSDYRKNTALARLRNRGKIGESAGLDEAAFVSDSPSTGASRGVKFDVQKNKEKSTGEHANGQPREHHDVYHDGKHVGHVASYSGYKDKKAPGARIVSSRKNVRLWQATVHGGEHNRHGSVFNTTPAGSQYTGTGFASKKDALQHFADAHNSNKSR